MAEASDRSGQVLVSVIIVTWNGRSRLQRCLPSLMTSLSQVHGVVEVIVVDNGSADGAADLVARGFPSVLLIRNAQNRGFSSANNQAIAIARGAYVATLNDDTEVHPMWLARLIEALSRDSSVGMGAAQLRFLERPEVINSAGITVDRAGIASNRLSECQVIESEDHPVEVFGACAAAALYRRELLDQLGGFDDAFFAYLEDVDLAWRARRAGWRCVYVPDAVVWHEYSASSRRVPELKAFLSGRNRVWLLAKNASSWQLLAYGAHMIVNDVLEVAVQLFRDGRVGGARGRLAAIPALRTMAAARHDAPFLPVSGFPPPRSVWSRLGRTRHRRPTRPPTRCASV